MVSKDLIHIIFEDEYLLAVHKPNNMLVHHSAMANNQLDEQSLVQILKEQIGSSYHPVHRLDRKTSGIILFAKKKEYVKVLQDLFVNQQIQKTYYGLVRGFIPENGKIDSPVKGRDANVHKDALTFYERLETYEVPIAVGPYDSSRYSLVKLSPKTGRLHQLRIHMNKISHPLIGDPKYGDRFHNRMFHEKFDCDTLFLHAKTLEFTHPFTDKKQICTNDFPSSWEKVISKLESIKL